MSEVSKNVSWWNIMLFGRRIAVFNALAVGICGELIWLATWLYDVKHGQRNDGWYAFFHQPVMAALDDGITAHYKPLAQVWVFALFSVGLAMAWIAFWFAMRRSCAGVSLIYNEIRRASLRSRVGLFGLAGLVAALVLMTIFWLPLQPARGSDDSVFLLVEPPVPGSHGRRLCLVNESKYLVSVSQRSGVPMTFSRHFVDNHWVEPWTGGLICGTGISYRLILPFHRFLIAPLHENNHDDAQKLKYQVGLDYSIDDGTGSYKSGTAWSEVLHE